MINGVSISELRSVELTHRAHFRRLKQIITQPAAPQSDPEMAQVVRNRKQNHKQWLKFKKNRQADQLKRENETQRLKLERIRMGNSIYACQSRSFNSSVAHNFYNRKKMEMKIDNENPEIAKRLIQMQAYINTAKTQQEYGKMKEIMTRLEKFPVIDRLSSFSHKNKQLRTEGDLPSSHLYSPTGTRNFSVPRRARGYF